VAGALTFIGAAITRMGLAWADTLKDMTNEAIDFRNGAALAFTQMFETGTATIEDIEQAMLRVGREVPVPFEEMSEAMFDIFSSIEATVPEAEAILRAVSQAAVAGQTDVRGAMVPTIAMMNAFGLGAEDIGFILDQQFTTVQRGILTYDEFTQTIGKVIPAAKSSGQSIETMGATVAFLTKNGLSAAMAGTSAARAFELFAQPKTVKNLEDMGIAVRDSTGEFRQINEVLEDMDVIFGDLTAPERKEAFIDIFGQGRIQARRFFDIAIPNWREFNTLVDVFTSEETVGAMRRAYDIMMDQPRQKIDALLNRWQALRFEIGMHFIPLLEDKVIPFFDDLLSIWENLDSVMKGNIARWAAIGAIATVASGIFIVIVGIGQLLAAVFGASGFFGTLLAIGRPLLKFLGWVGLLASLAILVVKNWDKLVVFWDSTLRPAVKKVIEFFRPLIEDIIGKFQDKFDDLLVFFQDLGIRWLEFIDEFVPEIIRRFKDLPKDIEAIFQKAGDVIGPFFDALIALTSFITDVLIAALTNEDFLDTLEFIWSVASGIIEGTLEIMEGVLTIFAAVLEGDWGAAWDAFLEIFISIWDIIMEKTEGIRAWFVEVWGGIMTWFHDLWFDAWNAVKDFFTGIWDGIVDFAGGVVDWFQNTWNSGWEAITNFFSNIWTGIKDFFIAVWEGIVDWFQDLWENRVVQFLVIVLQIIYELFRIAFELVLVVIVGAVMGMWNTIVNTWNNITRFLGVAMLIIKTLIVGAWNIIFPIVKTVVTNIWRTIVFWFNRARDFLSGVWRVIKGIIIGAWNIIAPTVKRIVGDIWRSIIFWFNLIKGWLGTMWNNLKTAAGIVWEQIKDKIVDPVIDAYWGIVRWFNKIRDKLSWLLDEAIKFVSKILTWLQKLNPFSFHSTPIAITVLQGFDMLSSNMAAALDAIEKDTRDRVIRIRDEVGNLRKISPEIGGGGALALASAGGPSIEINVTTLSEQNIADEVAWAIRIQ